MYTRLIHQCDNTCFNTSVYTETTMFAYKTLYKCFNDSVHTESTENRQRIDRESTENRQRIDRESTENQQRIDNVCIQSVLQTFCYGVDKTSVMERTLLFLCTHMR